MYHTIKHICAYMHLFFLHVLYTVWCLSKLYTDTIFLKATCKGFQKKKKKKEKTQIGSSVRTRIFKAGLLARTGQLDQSFPWFSLVPEQMLCWYPNSTLHCMLLMQPSQR
jgi:hypothetical protein